MESEDEEDDYKATLVKNNGKKAITLTADEELKVNTTNAVFEGVLRKVVKSVETVNFIAGHSHKRYYVLDL